MNDRLKLEFQRYLDNVRRSIPTERLIEYRVTEGRKPLCHALHVPIPDTLFPTANSRESFTTRTTKYFEE